MWFPALKKGEAPMTQFVHAPQGSRLNHIVVTVFATAVVLLAGFLSLAQFATV